MSERDEAPDMRIVVYGPDASIATAIEVAEAMKKLLEATGSGVWSIASVQFQCDGCGLKRPDKPGPDEGWTHEAGNDFCPACRKEDA